MAAPVLARRTTVFVAKIGTDDAGYNVVGAPQARLTIAQALADLASMYDAATPAAPKLISIEPGTYVTPAFAIPPNVFIQADPDAEGGSDAEVIIQLTGNITLAAAWSANTAAVGGLRGVTIRQEAGISIDLTLPVPAAGSPARVVTLQDVRTDVDTVFWQATGTGDVLNASHLVQDGNSGDAITLTGGTLNANDIKSAAPITYASTTVALAANISGVYTVATPSATSPGVSFVSGATNLLARMGNCDNRALTLNEAGVGTLTVYADATSIPLAANITYSGTATTADLIRTTDNGGIGPSPGGGNSQAGLTNNAGNTTITITAANTMDQLTIGGVARTSNIILAQTGALNGSMIDLSVSFPTTQNIVVNFRDGTAGGTSLSDFTTDGVTRTGRLTFVNTGTAWILQPPATYL